MGALRILTNGQTLVLSAATNGAGITVGIYSDAAYTTAVSLPYTTSVNVTLYARPGDVRLTITAADGTVVYQDVVGVGTNTAMVEPRIELSRLRTAFTGLSATYAGKRSARTVPRLKSLPVLMSSPPTIAFVGASNPTSSITSAVFLPASNVAFPGTATALSANFTYRHGIVSRYQSYYGQLFHNTGGANHSIPLLIPGWFYGQKIEFGYRGEGNLSSRLSVNGDYAEAVYTSDTTLNGAPHLRSFDFGSAAWRYLEFETAAAFYGINIGPTDTWVPAPAPSEKLLVIADSYGEGTGATASFTAWPFTFARLLGFQDIYDYSLGGTGVLNVNGSSPKYRDRAADWAATGASTVIIQHSINDDGFTTTQITDEMALLVPAVKAALPNAQVWVAGPAARGGGNVASKQPRDAVFAAQAAALGLPYSSLVNGPRPLWTGTGGVESPAGTGNSDILYHNSGGLSDHPTQAGHDAIAYTHAINFASQLPAA